MICRSSTAKTQEMLSSTIARFFAAPPAGRAQALRRLFIEKLDFAGSAGAVSLASAPKNVALRASAERIACMESLHVVLIPLATLSLFRRLTHELESGTTIRDEKPQSSLKEIGKTIANLYGAATDELAAAARGLVLLESDDDSSDSP